MLILVALDICGSVVFEAANLPNVSPVSDALMEQS